MKLKIVLCVLLIGAFLVACSPSYQEEKPIANTSIDDMRIDIVGTKFQLYQPLSSLLENNIWDIKGDNIRAELNADERIELDLFYEGNEEHSITVQVMNASKDKIKMQDALLQEVKFVNSDDEFMRFELPNSVNLGTNINNVIKAYGIPNIYVRKDNGDYQITYVCSKNIDIKNIMELNFRNEKLAEVKLKSKVSPYDINNKASFKIKKVIGYEPYIDISEFKKAKNEDLKNGIFHIGDLEITPDTAISDFYDKGWIIKTLNKNDDDFSYMILEKRGKEIYVAFNKVYEAVGDLDNHTKFDFIMLSDTSLFKLNDREGVMVEDIIDEYGTPNEIYYDAGKTVFSYYYKEGQGKIIFKANLDHHLVEVHILQEATFQGLENAWDSI